MAFENASSSMAPTILSKLDLSDSSNYLPSNLFQPRNFFFNRNNSNQSRSGVQQLLLRRNRLDSLQSYAKAILQLKQYLTELSLRENNFSQFPTEVLVLKNLTSLSLAFNRLETIERDTLSQLVNLQWLNLSHNKLKDLPIDIVCCHQLRGLDLEDNTFTSFPPVIFYLTRLEVLLIQKNNIKSLPKSHDFPSSLHTLNLAFNLFKEIPTTLILNPPKALTHLHLSGNCFEQLSRDFLSTGYENLVSLDLHTCQLTYLSSYFFQRLSYCKDLRRVNLAINRLTDLPDAIGLLKQLQWLNLNDNQLINLPASLSKLTGLVKLGLVQNQLHKLPPFVFKNMLQLQKLDMRRNQLRYLPPSMLALAPHQEVDMHVDLSVPCQVFSLSRQQDDHPYGGSLRTFLFSENPTMEYADGILCHLNEKEEEEDEDDCVQVISMTKIHYVVQQHSHQGRKQALRQALTSNQSRYHYSHHSKFRRPDHPIPSPLSEIDEDDDSTNHEHNDNDPISAEEKAAIQQETHYLLTQMPSLREICLRTLITTNAATIDTTCNDSMKQEELIRTILPNMVVPTMLHLDAMTNARQCDFCSGWYIQSQFQVGYLARLCNHRLQVPLRFDVCSVDCAVDAVDKLYHAKVDWQAKQSLAQMDISLLPVAAQTLANRSWHTALEVERERRVELSTAQINNENERVDGHQHHSSPTSSYQTVPSASTSSASGTTSSVSSSSSDEILHQPSSFTRAIRDRVTQLTSNLFVHRSNTSDINMNQQNNPAQQQQERLLPLVFPNLNLGVPAPVIQLNNDDSNSGSREEPPAIISMATRLVEGRLQTERTQPQLRLSTPLPNPTAFNHLPRDAIRLEKF